MKICTYLKSLTTAVACLFVGVQAQAQFTGSVEQYPTTAWEGSPIEFTLSDVAAALDTNAATLGAAIAEYIAAETPATLLFSANGTEWTAETTAANNGFWMTAEGTPVAYGETSVWYCSPNVDEDYTTLVFNVGQMPSVMAAGDKGETTITLKYNDKEVTFALTLNVIAKPEYEVPEPTILESQLTIVGEQETVIEQYPRGDYSSDEVKIKLGDALSLLGITEPNLLVDAIDKVLYTTWYNDGDVEQGGGMKKDSLTNTPTGEGHGFWYRAVQNADGEEDGEVAAAGWNAVDKFFMNHFTYTAEDDSLSCLLGQYPGTCKDNEEWFAKVYLIYGEKAYRIKYTLKLMEKEQGSGLAGYTKVGEEVVIVEQEPTTDYTPVAIHPDMDAIAAALGCEVSAVGIVALDDKDNFASSTANNGGFWFSDAGTVVAWGNGAMFVEPATANDYTTLNVGQHPERAYQIGEEGEAYLYFTNATNYYAYTVRLKIVEPQFVEYGFKSVETRTFNVQAIPTIGQDYQVGDLITIASESIEAILGTTTPTLYGLAIDSVAAVKGVYSNAYSCDPKPGFWLNKDGRVSIWGDADARVGISWVSNSILRFFSYPGRNSYGDVFTTQLFLVNEETNEMITININLNFVESLIEKNIVGSENLVIPLTTDDGYMDIDLSKAAEALGITVDDILSYDNYYMRGMKSDGVYGEGMTTDNGLLFSLDGGYDLYGDISLQIINEDKTQLYFYSNVELADDYNVNAQFCFDVDNNQYVYYVKFVSDVYYENNISTIVADRHAGMVYDLQGRRIVKPVQGLYILNGKKVIVK